MQSLWYSFFCPYYIHSKSCSCDKCTAVEINREHLRSASQSWRSFNSLKVPNYLGHCLFREICCYCWSCPLRHNLLRTNIPDKSAAACRVRRPVLGESGCGSIVRIHRHHCQRNSGTACEC